MRGPSTSVGTTKGRAGDDIVVLNTYRRPELVEGPLVARSSRPGNEPYPTRGPSTSVGMTGGGRGDDVSSSRACRGTSRCPQPALGRIPGWSRNRDRCAGSALFSCLDGLLVGNSGLEAVARIRVGQPPERQQAKDQTAEQGKHHQPDPDTPFLFRRFFMRQRRHPPFRRCWIDFADTQAWRAARRLRPGRCGGGRRAAQCLQIGAAVLAESTAGRILPRAIWTSDQSNASYSYRYPSPNGHILNRRRRGNRLPAFPMLRAPSADRAHPASHCRSD